MFDWTLMINFTFMFPIEYYLCISITELGLQTISFIGNGFVVFLFYRFQRLRNTSSLRLMFLLALTDAIFAILSMTQIANFVAHWNPIQLDYDPVYSVITNAPLTIQFKINMIITLAVAIDRFQAIRRPSYYRHKNHIFHSTIAIIFAFLFGAIDVVLEFVLTSMDTHFSHIKGCVAGGCFTSNTFQIYWGLSNMVLGIIGILFTAIVAFELKKFSTKNQNLQFNNEKKQLSQANRLAMAILTTSLIFTMTPSFLVGISQIIGLHLFKNLGSFYTFFLLCAGVLNFIIDMTLNPQIKRALIATYKGGVDMVTPLATLSPPVRGNAPAHITTMVKTMSAIARDKTIVRKNNFA